MPTKHSISRTVLLGAALAVVILISLASGQTPAAPANPAVRFTQVDLFLDSGEAPLAAYQLEFKLAPAEAKVAGIEGGEHLAFREPPFYDAEALQQERIILAAFKTGEVLPKGKTRVATVHLMVTAAESPKFTVTLSAAGTIGGKAIRPALTWKERKPE